MDFQPILECNCATGTLSQSLAGSRQSAKTHSERTWMMPKILGPLFIFALPCLAQQANWTGPYKPCANSAELKKTGHMSLGVRYDVSNPVIVQQFHRAFNFWSKLLDASFFDEQSPSCAIAIVSGTKAILDDKTIVARAQLPDRLNFRGWIAIDSEASTDLSQDEAVAVWIHEIGHLLGLKHNPSAGSLMYYIDADARSRLDAADLHALAELHALRSLHLTQ